MPFTAHNVRLDDGSETIPGHGYTIAQLPNTLCMKRYLDLIYPGDYRGKRIVDLGCLEGGFATEFARMGLDSTGIEVRKSNFDNCMFIKEHVRLPNLSFRHDDAWNVGRYGPFDIVFCVGLFYHMQDPRRFMQELSKSCRKMLFLDTHFAPDRDDAAAVRKYSLSGLSTHEGLPGRWYPEHRLDVRENWAELDSLKWASWQNQKSFWLSKPALLTAMLEAGFDIVVEAFYQLGEGLVKEMGPGGYMDMHSRSTFIGIRSVARSS